jgi:MFS family permease
LELIDLNLADRAMQKALKKNLPLIILMYLLAHLDRSNIGFAKQALQLDTGLSDAAFALGAGLFFVGYAVFEVPSNIAMHYVGARLWLARIMITWGLVASSFAFVTNETMFYFLRILLGMAEAGFFPGIIYFLTIWFSARRRSTITGLFYMAMPLSMVFGSPLSGFLLDLNGMLGLHGWQWMFLIEGSLTVIVGLYSLSYLVDRPQDATWISPEEKQALSAELLAEEGEKRLLYTNPLRVLIDPRVWYLSVICLPVWGTLYGISFYLPTQVAALLGEKVGFEVGLVSAIPYLCATIALVIIPAYSDKTGNRAGLAALLMACSGVALMLSGTSDPIYGIIALSIAMTGCITTVPIFWALPSRFLLGVTAASGIALINSISHLGSFLSPSLRVWAEQHFQNPNAGLYAIGLVALVGALLFLTTIPLGMGNNVATVKSASFATASQMRNLRERQ